MRRGAYKTVEQHTHVLETWQVCAHMYGGGKNWAGCVFRRQANGTWLIMFSEGWEEEKVEGKFLPHLESLPVINSIQLVVSRV